MKRFLLVTAALICVSIGAGAFWVLRHPEKIFYALVDLPKDAFTRPPQFRFHSFYPLAIELDFDTPDVELRAFVAPGKKAGTRTLVADVRLHVKHLATGAQALAVGNVEYDSENTRLWLKLPEKEFKTPWVKLSAPGDVAAVLDSHFGLQKLTLELPNVASTLRPDLPAKLNLQLKMSDAQKGAFTYAVDDKTFGQKVTGQGDLDLARKQITANYKSTIRLKPEMDLGKVLPALKILKAVKSEIDLKGRVKATDRGLKSLTADVDVKRLRASVDGVPIRKIRTKISAELFPHITTQPFTLTIKSIGEDIAAQGISLQAKVNKGPVIVVEGMRASLLDGEVKASGFEVDLNKLDAATRVTLDHVDLRTLLKHINPEKMDGIGKIGGVIPLHLRGDRMLVEGAILKNDGPGRISYRDELTLNVKEKIDSLEDFTGLLAQGQQALAFKALNNFHFTLLSITAQRGEKTGLELELKLKGKNPDLAKGQPFELNLPITGNVEALVVQTLLKSFTETDEWDPNKPGEY